MRHIRTLICFGAIVLAAACAREAVFDDPATPSAPEVIPAEAETVETSFSVSLPEDVPEQTKALGDGSQVTKLWVWAFGEDGKRIPELSRKLAMENGYANVRIRLRIGKTYTFAFWAASDAYDADGIFTESENDVKANLISIYDNYGLDSPNVEAFYGKVTVTAGEDPLTCVVLKRPFAQVNIGIPYADSLYAANTLGVSVEQVQMKSRVDIPPVFHLSDGTVDGLVVQSHLNYAAGLWDRFIDVRDNTGAPIEAECYTRAACLYVLADDAHDTMGGFDFYLKGQQNGSNFEFVKGISGTPVKPNQQTNILGNLFQGNLEPWYHVSLFYDLVPGVYVNIHPDQNWFREGDQVIINIELTTDGVSILDIFYETMAYYYVEHLQVTSTSLSDYQAQFVMPASEVEVYIIFVY